MAGLPNFGSSFADALISTMGALDARKRSQREERQWAEEDAMKQALKNSIQEGQVIGVRGEPVGRFANEAEADAAMKSSTPEALRNTRVTMAPSPTAQMPAEDVSKALGIGPLPTFDKKNQAVMKPPVAAPEAKAMPVAQQGMPSAQAEYVPTVGEEEDARLANLVKFKDKSGQWLVADKANARTANKYDVMAERAAIYQQYGKDDMALQLQSRAEQMLERDAARNQKAALRILNTTGDINGALKKLSENDDVTLGANLQMMKNPDGTFSIGAAPDGTGLPPKALPGLTAKSPEDLRTLLNGVISDNFLGAQQMIFNQMVSLKDIEFKAQAQALAQKKFEFDVKDSDRRFGLAVKESNRRGAAGGGNDGYGAPSTMPVYGTDADGNRVQVGQDVVRKGKGGKIEALSTAFGQYMPYGYDWDRLAADMRREGSKLGLQVGIDEKTGLPAYRGLKSGKVRPVSANTLEAYRRK